MLLYASIIPHVCCDGSCLSACFSDLPLDGTDDRLLGVWVWREGLHCRCIAGRFRCYDDCGLALAAVNAPIPYKTNIPEYPFFAKSTATCLPIPREAPTTRATCWSSAAIFLYVSRLCLEILGFRSCKALCGDVLSIPSMNWPWLECCSGHIPLFRA